MIAVVLLGAVLGLDSLRVSLALGTQELSLRRRLQIALAFGLCDGVAPLLGMLLGRSVGEVIERWAAYIAPLLLGGYGLYMAAVAWLGTEKESDSRWVMFGIPIALSLDNLAAGTALGLIRFPVLWSAFIIGVISAVMSFIGLDLGARALRRLTRKAELLGGLVLILCAIFFATD